MPVKIVEVGPRDGLQNESITLTVKLRTKLIQRLTLAGLKHIEVGAFVSPKSVPQMADTDAVLAHLNQSQAEYSVLVPNITGLNTAIAAGAKSIAIFTAASESFNQRNINASVKQSLTNIEAVCELASSLKIPVRGYVSCAIHCPFEGFIPPAQVAPIIEQLFKLGCCEVSIGDTTGRGTVKHVNELLTALLPGVPLAQLAGHFHDTYGQGLANILQSREHGVSIFDTSVAGLGGCPFAPGASGNVATEDVVYLFETLGEDTSIDLDELAQTGQWISGLLRRRNNSKAGAALSR